MIGLVSVGTSGPVGAVAKAGWSVVPSPNKGPAVDENGLGGVSCASPSSCTAVGGFGDTTLVESWNGTSWSVVPSPNEGAASSLYGVSCASPSSCTAVGYWNNNGVSRTLVESWNGARWSVVPSPNEGAASNYLQGVSCASPSSCTAVGYYQDNTGVSRTLVQSWHGRGWSVVPSPNEGPAASADNSLQGVSCASGSACTAVGTFGNKTLVASWNSARWSVVPSPNKGPASGDNSLQGVSCASASSCTAVGYYRYYYQVRGVSGVSTKLVQSSLVESWDGTSWSVVPSPNEGAAASGGDFLYGVSCASASSCTAVGTFGNKTLVESWNGARWSVVPSPNEGAASSLDAVSCASASSCTAVGDYVNSSGPKTLVETS